MAFRPAPTRLAAAMPRFALSSLLLAVTAAAVLGGVVILLPRPLNQLLVGAAWLAACSWFFSGLLFARGERQAFCLGQAVALASLWTGVGGRFMEAGTQLTGMPFGGFPLGGTLLPWVELTMLLTAGAACGRLCQIARRRYVA
jgi:hypothetical protein